MTTASDQVALEKWLRERAKTEMTPSYHQIGAAFEWGPDYARTLVQALRSTIPLYIDHYQCVNPWSVVDPEIIVTKLFPHHYFSGE